MKYDLSEFPSTYQKIADLDSVCKMLSSTYASFPMATLGMKVFEESQKNFTSSIHTFSQIGITSSNFLKTQTTMTGLNSSLGESIVSAALSASELALKNIPISPDFASTLENNSYESNQEENYILLDQSNIKEYDLFESLAISIGHNCFRIKLDTLIAIISLIITIFSALKPSATYQEQLALQKNEVQILSEILDNATPSNSKTALKLESLKESVDEANLHLANIEQSLKELAESENNESTSK